MTSDGESNTETSVESVLAFFGFFVCLLWYFHYVYIKVYLCVF